MVLSLRNLFRRKNYLADIPIEELEVHEIIERYETEFNMSLGKVHLTKTQLLQAYKLAKENRNPI